MTEQRDFSVWPGTDEEKREFLEAIARSCECIKPLGIITQVCKSHLLMTPNKSNYEYWQHLIYEKRLWKSERGFELRSQEFDSTRPENQPGIRRLY